MRHPLHAICPYYAMFPEQFVEHQLEKYTSIGDVVFDPFCGRGTTVFQSLLSDRNGSGVDINPVAACISAAKADPPELTEVLGRLSVLSERSTKKVQQAELDNEFFRACFHSHTLNQLLSLRTELNWRDDPVDRFIAALVLGCLHGESHRSPTYFSNRMPRTISTKPDYSVRWWERNGYIAPKREVFEILTHQAQFRLSVPGPMRRGRVLLQDARAAALGFPELAGRVSAIITSPPYVDTTNFREDQWLRLWFLGGAQRPVTSEPGDDRYRSADPYWKFLTEAWAGCAPLLGSECFVVVRLGGAKLSQTAMLAGLQSSLSNGCRDFRVTPLHEGIRSEIVRSQTAAFHPGFRTRRVEVDFAFSVTRMN